MNPPILLGRIERSRKTSFPRSYQNPLFHVLGCYVGGCFSTYNASSLWSGSDYPSKSLDGSTIARRRRLLSVGFKSSDLGPTALSVDGRLEAEKVKRRLAKERNGGCAIANMR